MKIALSKGSGSDKYAMYHQWLSAVDSSVQVVDMNARGPADAVRELAECDGLVLTGGPDVAPERYGEPEKRAVCTAIDEVRDELEFALIEAARDLNVPTLGICRGAQILNVAYGGTLIADIPSATSSTTEHRQVDSTDSQHSVHIESGSILKHISRVLDANVNSAHHQAVEKLATLFTASARSSDGLIEAFEWGDATLGGKPFLLGVQWHPERMVYSDPLSLDIAEHFLYEVQSYRALIKKR